MVRRVFLRLGDYLFVTRPLILIPVWSFYLLGARTGQRSAIATAAEWAWPGFVCLTAIMVTAYLINQVFDQESDRHNDKGHYLTRGIFSVRAVVAMALVSFVVASLTFQWVEPAQRLPLAIALALSLVYSLPPIRLCARPILDLAANAVGYGGVAFLVGHLTFDDGVATGVAAALPYVALVGATFLHTTILDVEGDRASGKNTTTVLVGVSASAVLALVLSMAGLAWAWAVTWRTHADPLPLILLALATPAFAMALSGLRRARDGSARASSYAVQFATLVVTVAAAVVEPLYLVLVVPIVILARYYYRSRFGVAYPGAAGAAGATGTDPSNS